MFVVIIDKKPINNIYLKNLEIRFNTTLRIMLSIIIVVDVTFSLSSI